MASQSCSVLALFNMQLSSSLPFFAGQVSFIEAENAAPASKSEHGCKHAFQRITGLY
jgi:hypothetical protein